MTDELFFKVWQGLFKGLMIILFAMYAVHLIIGMYHYWF